MNNGMFIPNIPIGYGMPTFTGINPNLASGLGVARNLGLSRGLGGLSGKAGLFRSVNWGGLLNNASKALGVVNQAVPLVKQAGPMVNNMKSMLKLASMFKDETDGEAIVLGPAMANVFKMNNVYRYKCTVKYRKSDKLEEVLTFIDGIYRNNVRVSIEVDVGPSRM